MPGLDVGYKSKNKAKEDSRIFCLMDLREEMVKAEGRADVWEDQALGFGHVVWRC